MTDSAIQQFAILLVFVATLFGSFDQAAADAGDVLAGLLFSTIGLVCVCAFLGWWSRRQTA